MTKYTLHYFAPGRGKAEVIRLVFHQAKIEFQDERVAFEQFVSLKPTLTSTGFLPVLHVDGEELNEALVIARYIANVGGLAGANEWEKAQTDSVSSQVSSFMENNKIFMEWLRTTAFQEEHNIVFEPAWEKFKTEVIPKIGERFTGILDKNGSGWLVGKNVTWCDLQAADLIDRCIKKDSECFNEFAKVLEHHKKVHALPNLQEYLKTRPSNAVMW